MHNVSHYPNDIDSRDSRDEGELLGGHLGGDPDGGAGGSLLLLSQVSRPRTGHTPDPRGLSEIL